MESNMAENKDNDACLGLRKKEVLLSHQLLRNSECINCIVFLSGYLSYLSPSLSLLRVFIL